MLVNKLKQNKECELKILYTFLSIYQLFEVCKWNENEIFGYGYFSTDSKF